MVLMQDESCEFCLEATTGRVADRYSTHIGVATRVLLARASATVIPTLSPLRKNHVLIVPRRHITSSVHMNDDEQRDANDCLAEVTDRLAAPGQRFILFEHGIGSGQTGGCGVSHCHIHVMPAKTAEATAIHDFLADDLRKRFTQSESAPGADSSYVRLEVHGRDLEARIMQIGEFPSQYIRNQIENTLGLQTTSWRQLVRSNLIVESIRDARWS